MNKTVLMPLPSKDFDPTESAIPWKILTQAGINVRFATPTGRPAQCDERMLSGKGLGIFSPVLIAGIKAQTAYQTMSQSHEFQTPLTWSEINSADFAGLILPGGHASGMKEYLESKVLQNIVREFFESQKPVGAICHGVVLAARSRSKTGQSVLSGRKTTALLATQELLAWGLTCLWLGSYYRTYPQTVQAEVTAALRSPSDFVQGPTPLLRDSMENLGHGFAVVDGNYVSARWPGDAHAFSTAFLVRLQESNRV